MHLLKLKQGHYLRHEAVQTYIEATTSLPSLSQHLTVIMSTWFWSLAKYDNLALFHQKDSVRLKTTMYSVQCPDTMITPAHLSIIFEARLDMITHHSSTSTIHSQPMRWKRTIHSDQGLLAIIRLWVSLYCKCRIPPLESSLEAK